MKKKVVNISNKLINYYAFIFVVCLLLLSFSSCSIRISESTQDYNPIWGFGNSNKNKINNTYKDNSVPVAKEDTYSYYSSEEFQSFIIERLNGELSSIYEKDYQDTARELLEQLKNDKLYSFEYPLFIVNPFGTNPSGLYVYMGYTKEKVAINYSLSVEEKTISDFQETLYINQSLFDVEGQIIGLLQGRKNKVVIEVNDTSGGHISKKAYYIEMPDLDTIKEETLNAEFSKEFNFTRGLYTFHALDEKGSHYLFYDNFGTIRAEIPSEIKNAPSKIIKVENDIFYPVRDDLFVLVNSIGYVEKYYTFTYDTAFKDYDCDEINNKILFIIDNKEESKEKIVNLDLETGDWREVIDFSKLIKIPLKLNSLQVVDGKDIIISSSDLSSIIRINNIYTIPVLRWIIADEKNWIDTKYESFVLSNINQFEFHSSQDVVFYNKERKLKEGQFYISFFNYGISKESELTNPNNNDRSDKNVTKDHSYYYRYLVDESLNRYELIQKLQVPFNINSCMAFPYGSNVIISLGSKKEFSEYNSKGEIMSKYYINSTNSSYQIFKYTMDRYWF